MATQIVICFVFNNRTENTATLIVSAIMIYPYHSITHVYRQGTVCLCVLVNLLYSLYPYDTYSSWRPLLSLYHSQYIAAALLSHLFQFSAVHICLIDLISQYILTFQRACPQKVYAHLIYIRLANLILYS